jgi:hypothetical protein
MSPKRDSRRDSNISGQNEPLSPPTSPEYLEDQDFRENGRTNPRAARVEDAEDLEDRRASSGSSVVSSSPPTSFDLETEKLDDLEEPLSSARTSISGLGEYPYPDVAGEGPNRSRVPSLTLSQFEALRSEDDGNDELYDRRHQSNMDDPDSQWESEGPADRRRHGSASSTPNIYARKSATPSSGKIVPRPSRQSTISSKPHLHPKSNSRGSNNYYSSRASSASYSGMPMEEKKAPLVLLHVTLLFLPGAEEAILRKITPTMLERGLLIEHPRGDYQLLEELIIDSLGLDEALVPGQEDQEDEMDEWERSLGVRRLQGKRKWELRVYAANGLMTPGAWKRVWGEMERIDAEVGPKGWRGKKVGAPSWKKRVCSVANRSKKTEDLIRGFARSQSGVREMILEKSKRRRPFFFVPPTADVKLWGAIAGVFFVLFLSMGLFWTFQMRNVSEGLLTANVNGLVPPTIDVVSEAIVADASVVPFVEVQEEQVGSTLALPVDEENGAEASNHCAKAVEGGTATAVEVMTAKETLVDETVAEEMVAKETVAEEMVAEETVAEEMVAEETAAKETQLLDDQQVIPQQHPVTPSDSADETGDNDNEATIEVPTLLSFSSEDSTEPDSDGSDSYDALDWWNSLRMGLRV